MADFVNGFISSVQMTQSGLALNVHLKTAGLITTSLPTLQSMVTCLAGVRDFDQLQTIPEVKWQEINKVLHRLKIITFQGRSTINYTVNQLLPRDTPLRMTFKGKDGKQVTIAEYFKKVYLCELQELPLVQSLGKNQCHLPLELCYLVNKQFLPFNGHSERGNRE